MALNRSALAGLKAAINRSAPAPRRASAIQQAKPRAASTPRFVAPKPRPVKAPPPPAPVEEDEPFNPSPWVGSRMYDRMRENQRRPDTPLNQYLAGLEPSTDRQPRQEQYYEDQSFLLRNRETGMFVRVPAPDWAAQEAELGDQYMQVGGVLDDESPLNAMFPIYQQADMFTPRRGEGDFQTQRVSTFNPWSTDTAPTFTTPYTGQPGPLYPPAPDTPPPPDLTTMMGNPFLTYLRDLFPEIYGAV